MIMKCPWHKIVRVSGRRRTCPECGLKLTKVSSEELFEFTDGMMDRARAAQAYVESAHPCAESTQELKLAAFMSIFHGKSMSRTEIQEMRK